MTFSWKLGVAVVAAATLIVIAAIAIGGGRDSTGPVRHRDGEGPLVSSGDPGGASSFAANAEAAGSEMFSYGIPLCLAQPGGKAELMKVEPHAVAAGDVVTLGVLARRFASTDSTPVIGIDGFPPAGMGASLRPVEGFAIEDACVPGPDPYVGEVIVGLERQGTEGGGWLGADVTYRFADRIYILEARYDMLICGTRIAAECSAAPS